MRGRARWALGLLLATLPAMAAAQGEAPRAEIVLDIDTTLLTAYRPGAWAPVDVMLVNRKKDFTGYIELTVRTPQGELVQDMYFRAPVQSARGSRKRVRFYVPLSTGILEALAFDDRGRRLTPFPAKFEPQPVLPSDFMPLLLDEEPDAFGFLYDAMQRMAPDIRMHRVILKDDQVDLLPEYVEALNAYDLMVLGAIEPGQLGAAQRNAIEAFAANGGVVVICLGENAPRYRNSWLAERAGVAIGGQSTVAETDLAASFFGPGEDGGTTPNRPVVVTAMQPRREGLRTWGAADRPLAVMAPFGQGHIVFVSIDPTTDAMRRCPSFLRFWAELRNLRVRSGDLAFDQAATLISERLPEATGIRVFPRTFVIAYLGAYVLIGVLGNWLFWSWLKRREWAWVCLILFSAAFTAFAVIYGTAGRAKETELYSFQAIRTDARGAVSRVQSLTGLLTAGTSTYTFTVERPRCLVSPAQALSLWNNPWERPSMLGGLRPFAWVDAQPTRITDFTVGASELRMLQISHDSGLSGGFESTLVYDGERIAGAVRNETGLEVEMPALYFAGAVYPLEQAGSVYRLNQAHTATSAREWRTLGRIRSGGMLRRAFVDGLLGDPAQQDAVVPGLSPKVLAWVDAPGAPAAALAVDPAPAKYVAHRLLVADVAVDYRATIEQAPVELEVILQEGRRGYQQLVQATPFSDQQRGQSGPFARYAQPLYVDGECSVSIRWTSSISAAAGQALVLNVIVDSHEFPQLVIPGNGAMRVLKPEGPDQPWEATNEYRIQRFRIADAETLAKAAGGDLEIRLLPKSRRPQTWIQALAELKPIQPYSKDWTVFALDRAQATEDAS